MNAKGPQTLVEAVRFFSDLDVAHAYFADMRWPNGPVCPRCGSVDVHYMPKYRRYQCGSNHPRRQFTVKVGTIMEDSPMALDKWAVAFWLEANAKNSVSSYEVHRALGITQKSAWFMQHRIRLALKAKSFDKLGGEVESDESFFGGSAKNMHAHKRKQLPYVRGFGGKTVVHGLIERGDKTRPSKVRAHVVPNTKAKTLVPIIVSNVEKGANVYTDYLQSYKHLSAEGFVHEAIDHAEAYVRGRCHTNGLENFWSLFKRCIKGTHVSIEPFHLAAYLDAEVFRFNNRKMTDGERFAEAMKGFDGKRLTYKALIGSLEGTPGSDDSGAAGERLPN